MASLHRIRTCLYVLGITLCAACGPRISTAPKPTFTPVSTLPSPIPTLPASTVGPQPHTGAPTTPALLYSNPRTHELLLVSGTDEQVIADQLPVEALAVAPDGTRIAVRTAANQLVMLEWQRGRRNEIAAHCDSMTWADDSQSLYCSRLGNVYQLSADGSRDVLITPAGVDSDYRELAWRPHSQQLWFSMQEGDAVRMCAKTIQQSNLICIDDGTRPAWSGSGEWFAYQRDNQLITQHADASQRRVLQTGHDAQLVIYWLSDDILVLVHGEEISQFQRDDGQIRASPLRRAGWVLVGVMPLVTQFATP